jgi:hypothetical protein
LNAWKTKPISRLRMRRPLARFEALDGAAVEHVLPLGRRIEQSQDGQQGGLAAARRPVDGDIFAFLNVHVDSREGMGLHLVGVEDFLDAVEFEKRFIHLC